MSGTSGDEPGLLVDVEQRLATDGWRIDRTEAAAGVYQIAALHSETETRRLLVVLPNPDATVQPDHCRWLAEQAGEMGVDTAELVAAGRVTDEVRRVAQERGISLLDPASFRISGGRTQAVGRNTAETSGAGTGRDETTQNQSGMMHGQRAGQTQQTGQTRQTEQTQRRTGQTHQQTEQTLQQPGQSTQHAQQGHSPGPATSPENGNSSGIDWELSRLVTVGGGILAGVSLFLPWVVAIQGVQDWNAMATQFSPVLLAGVALAVLLPAATWGAGWGRLSAAVAVLSGAGLGYVGLAVREGLSTTVTIGYIELDGQEVPLAAVESGVGLDVYFVAVALIAVGGIAGLVKSFR